jgi:excisionase family DNA binding protein
VGSVANTMTLKELASYLCVTEKTIYRLLWRGRIPAARVGKQWRFERGTIDAWVKRNSIGLPAKILVIDDDEEVRTSFRSIIQGLGDSVVAVPNGAEGLELLRRDSFDLVFLGLKVPVRNGAELLGQIRAMKPDQAVVIMTGYPRGEIMERALKYGPCAVMAKPFNESDIIAAARNFLYR